MKASQFSDEQIVQLLQQAERMRGELSEYADGLKGHIPFAR